MIFATEKYRVSQKFLEIIRLLARCVDFLLLIFWLRFKKRSFRDLNRKILIEFGPGPTKIHFLKKLIFKKVIYVDIDDFGRPMLNLHLWDLSHGFPNPSDLGVPITQDLIYFADHVFEHIQIDVVRDFFLKSRGFIIMRSPNIYDNWGLFDYENDKTHLTKFSKQEISSIAPDLSTNWVRFWMPLQGLITHKKFTIPRREIILIKENKSN